MVGEASAGEDKVGDETVNHAYAGYVEGEVEAAAEIVV